MPQLSALPYLNDLAMNGRGTPVIAQQTQSRLSLKNGPCLKRHATNGVLSQLESILAVDRVNEDLWYLLKILEQKTI